MATISRQTYEQFRIKNDMGFFRGVPFRIYFHWKVWKPLEAIGGPVRFGRYVEYDSKDIKE